MPRVYAALLVITIGGAVVALALTALSLVVQIALFALVIWVGARAWSQQSRWTGATIRLHRDGAAEWHRIDRGSARCGRLVGHWQAGPLVALTLEAEGPGRCRDRVAIWRDQINPEAWRRLLIVLRHDRRGGGALG